MSDGVLKSDPDAVWNYVVSVICSHHLNHRF